MKLAPIRYAFARDWPFKGYLTAWAILGVVMVVLECPPSREMFSDWIYSALFIVSLLLAPVLFAFCSLPVAFIVLGPLYYFGDRLAGAPFRVGDRVRILVGPHRDRVVEVHDVWESRRKVRVWLDGAAEKEVRDVFSFTQLCRENVV